MKNKKGQSENYLERRPVRQKNIKWSVSSDDIVTLEFENTGIFNCLAQRFLKKPKVSFVHLDKIGSYLWQLADGERDIIELGKLVDSKFGEESHPLYERLAKYFQILDSYHFINWKAK